MKRLLLMVLVMVTTAFAFSCHAQMEMTAESLIYKIKQQGAKGVVETLWDDQKAWQEVMKNISTGSRRWLEAAKLLRTGTDAGATLDLDFAVSEALPKTTLEVIQLIDSAADPDVFGKETFSVFDVCRIPFIDEDECQYAAARSYLNETEKALINVQIPQDAPKLELVRQNCLSQVRAWRSRFR